MSKNKGLNYIGQVTRKDKRTGVHLRAKIVHPNPSDPTINKMHENNKTEPWPDHLYKNYPVIVKEIGIDNYTRCVRDCAWATTKVTVDDQLSHVSGDIEMPSIGLLNCDITYELIENDDPDKKVSKYLNIQGGGKFISKPKYGGEPVTGYLKVTASYGKGTERRSASQSVPITIESYSADDVFRSLIDAKGVHSSLYKAMIKNQASLIGNTNSNDPGAVVDIPGTYKKFNIMPCNLNYVESIDSRLSDVPVTVRWVSVTDMYDQSTPTTLYVYNDADGNYKHTENGKDIFKLDLQNFISVVENAQGLNTTSYINGDPNQKKLALVYDSENGSYDTMYSKTLRAVQFGAKFKFQYELGTEVYEPSDEECFYLATCSKRLSQTEVAHIAPAVLNKSSILFTTNEQNATPFNSKTFSGNNNTFDITIQYKYTSGTYYFVNGTQSKALNDGEIYLHIPTGILKTTTYNENYVYRLDALDAGIIVASNEFATKIVGIAKAGYETVAISLPDADVASTKEFTVTHTMYTRNYDLYGVDGGNIATTIRVTLTKIANT